MLPTEAAQCIAISDLVCSVVSQILMPAPGEWVRGNEQPGGRQSGGHLFWQQCQLMLISKLQCKPSKGWRQIALSVLIHLRVSSEP